MTQTLVKVEEDENNVYVYTKLDNKTNYKNTFKNANSNYYWTSSEIVK